MIPASLLLACAEQLPDVGPIPRGHLPGETITVADSDSEPPQNVVLLLLQGVRTEEFSRALPSPLTGKTGQQWASSSWSTLASRGTVVRAILNPGMTDAVPSHAALFSGKSLSFSDLPASSTSFYRPELPTLFQVVEKSAFLTDDPQLADSSSSLSPGLSPGPFSLFSTDAEVFSAIRSTISNEHPQLLVASLHGIDAIAHANGDYPAAVQAADTAIASLYAYLQQEEADYLSRTLLIVTTDHGRHAEDWQNHGDDCISCRSLPLFLVGADIPVSERSDRWIPQDLTILMAGWLGVRLPYAEGLPLPGILPLFEFQKRRGEVTISSAAGHRAWQEWSDDPDHRSVVKIDDEVVSDPAAFAAEAPSLAYAGADLYGCWRELHLEAADEWPWLPRCLRISKDTTEPIFFPIQQVSARWRPALGWDGGLLAGWVEDQAGQPDRPPKSNLAFGRYSLERQQWSAISRYPADWPTDPVLTVAGGRSFLAAAVGGARDQRRILFLDPQEESSRLFSAGPALSPARLEHPAINLTKDGLYLAALATNASGTHLLRWHSEDFGKSWSDPEEVASPFPILPHLAPRFLEGNLVWAALDKQQLVHFYSDSPLFSPITTLSARVDSFEANNQEIWASADMGNALWHLLQFPWTP